MKAKREHSTEFIQGHCGEAQYVDLWEREARRSRTEWLARPAEYQFVAMICPLKRVTVVTVFLVDWGFCGAGVSTRCPTDDYNKEAGIRLALSRALSSIGTVDTDEEDSPIRTQRPKKWTLKMKL